MSDLERLLELSTKIDRQQSTQDERTEYWDLRNKIAVALDRINSGTAVMVPEQPTALSMLTWHLDRARNSRRRVIMAEISRSDSERIVEYVAALKDLAVRGGRDATRLDWLGAPMNMFFCLQNNMSDQDNFTVHTHNPFTTEDKRFHASSIRQAIDSAMENAAGTLHEIPQ